MKSSLIFILLMQTNFLSGFVYASDSDHLTPIILAEVKITQDEAAAIASKEIGGKVLSVDTDEESSNMHKVKLLLDSGHVKTIKVDSTSGKIIKE